MHASRTILSGLAMIALAGTVAAAQSSSMSSSKMSTPMTGKSVTVTMNAQNGSKETGTATLTQMGPNLRVKIALKNGTAKPQPAHIHPGTCAKLNPAPKYPLTSVVNGTSATLLKGLSLASLTSGTFAVNVHKSAAQVSTYVSCGDIKAKK